MLIIGNTLIYCVNKMQSCQCVVPCCRLCTNQWALRVPRALSFLYAKWHTVLYVSKIVAEIVLKILGANVQNLFFLKYVHPCEWTRKCVTNKTSEHIALALVFLRYKPQESSLFPHVSISFLLFLFPVYNKYATIHKIKSSGRHLPKILHLRRSLISHLQRPTNHQELAISPMTQSSSPSPSSPTTEKCRSSPPLNTTHPNYVICHLSTPRPEYSYQFIPNQQWAKGKLARPNERRKPTDNTEKGGPWWARLR